MEYKDFNYYYTLLLFFCLLILLVYFYFLFFFCVLIIIDYIHILEISINIQNKNDFKKFFLLHFFISIFYLV